MTSIDDPHPLRVLAHSNSSLPALSGEESQKMPTTDSQDAFADPTTPRHQSDPLPKLPYRSSWLNLTVIDQIPDFLFPLLPLLHSRHISPFLFLPLATLSISLPIYSHLLAPTAHDCLAISLILLALLTLVTSLLRIPFKRAFKAWWCISILIIALWISFETPPLVIGFVVSSPTVKIFPRIPVNCFAPRLAVVRFETDANVGGLTKAMNASEMKVAVGRWRSKIVPRRVHPDGHVYELDSREIADKEGFRFGLRCWGAPVLSLSPWVVFDRNTYDLKLLQTPPDLPIRPNVFHSLLQCVTNPGTNVPPLLYSFLQHRRVLIHIAFVWPLFTFFISKVYLLLRPIRSTPTPTQPPPSIQPPLKHTEKRPRSFSASNQNPRRTSVAFIEPPTSRRVSTPNRKALNIRRPSSSTHLRHSTPTRPTSTDDDETSYILLPNDQIPTPWQRTLPLHRRPKPRTRSTSLSSSTSTTIPASAVNQWRQELASKQTTSPPPPAPLTPPPTLRTVPHFRIAMPPPVPVAQMYTALAATPPSETSKWDEYASPFVAAPVLGRRRRTGVAVGGSVVVVKDYEPTMSDELRLSVNDIIRIVQTFDDGWAMGQTATSTPGMFPLACTTPFTTLSAPSTPSHALIDDDERGRGARAPPPLRGRSISRRRSIEVFVEDGEVEVYDGDGEFEEEEEVVVVEEGEGDPDLWPTKREVWDDEERRKWR